MANCSRCHGDGKDSKYVGCGNWREVSCWQCGGSGREHRWATCETCGGSGTHGRCGAGYGFLWLQTCTKPLRCTACEGAGGRWERG